MVLPGCPRPALLTAVAATDGPGPPGVAGVGERPLEALGVGGPAPASVSAVGVPDVAGAAPEVSALDVGRRPSSVVLRFSVPAPAPALSTRALL